MRIPRFGIAATVAILMVFAAFASAASVLRNFIGPAEDPLAITFSQGDHHDGQFPLDVDHAGTNPSERGGIALAFACVGALPVDLRRRRGVMRAMWAMWRSAAAAIAVAITAVLWLLFSAEPAAADVLYDFQLNDGGWTASYQGFVPTNNQWTYYSTGDKRWGVRAMGVDGVNAATANHLTSQPIDGIVDELPAQNARISIAHNFLLPPSGTGGPRPISTGQLAYRLNGSGPWIGLPLAAFTSGGDVNTEDPVFGPSPFKNDLDPEDPFYVDQTSFVAPTYLTPSDTAPLPYVAPDGASFVGQSNGWSSSLYVPSQAFLNINTGLPSSGITSLELRLTNANFGGNCNNNEGWNVRMVQVDFSSEQPPVPEPGTLALAAMGGCGVLAARALKRLRSHHRPSRPSESPCTTTLPPVSVAPMIGLPGQSLFV